MKYKKSLEKQSRFADSQGNQPDRKKREMEKKAGGRAPFLYEWKALKGQVNQNNI